MIIAIIVVVSLLILGVLLIINDIECTKAKLRHQEVMKQLEIEDLKIRNKIKEDGTNRNKPR